MIYIDIGVLTEAWDYGFKTISELDDFVRANSIESNAELEHIFKNNIKVSKITACDYENECGGMC
jgi:hypothetical protein